MNGYEGTGRALSLKLISNLRRDAAGAAAGGGGAGADRAPVAGSATRRTRAVLVRGPRGGVAERPTVPGRRGRDAAAHGRVAPRRVRLVRGEPRHALLRAHRGPELFLKRMMSLYVASHYKNTPNDLQLMADAPAHRLFVLLAPVDETANALPEILCVLQVALEGAISRAAPAPRSPRATRRRATCVPWTVAMQFQDPDFPMLSGARIVRIATHPDLPSQGYGSRRCSSCTRTTKANSWTCSRRSPTRADPTPGRTARGRRRRRPSRTAVCSGRPSSRARALPPLLSPLGEKRPEKCHWIAAAFGLTQRLHKFWTRAGYQPVYLRQTPSDATGEHSAVLIRALDSRLDEELEELDDDETHDANPEWLRAFSADFKQRFTSLLGGPFRDIPRGLALAVLAPPGGLRRRSRPGAAMRRRRRAPRGRRRSHRARLAAAGEVRTEPGGPPPGGGPCAAAGARVLRGESPGDDVVCANRHRAHGGPAAQGDGRRARESGYPRHRSWRCSTRLCGKCTRRCARGRRAKSRRICRKKARSRTSTRTPPGSTRTSRTGTPPRASRFSSRVSRFSVFPVILVRFVRDSPTPRERQKMRRDGSDGYNPGRRSPEVASAGATVYSGL